MSLAVARAPCKSSQPAISPAPTKRKVCPSGGVSETDGASRCSAARGCADWEQPVGYSGANSSRSQAIRSTAKTVEVRRWPTPFLFMVRMFLWLAYHVGQERRPNYRSALKIDRPLQDTTVR